MADRNEQIAEDIVQSKTDVLRAHDIIPTVNKRPESRPERADTATNEIPKFDLAEEIMAEQRKVTAVKRKGPAGKAKAEIRQPQVRLDAHVVEPPPPVPYVDRIISEIVGRDIRAYLVKRIS
jgi:hypothetical protein